MAGELVLGVLGLGAAALLLVVPGLRRRPAVAPHPRARIALLASFGVLFVVAFVLGRNALAPLTGALMVSCSLVLVIERRHAVPPGSEPASRGR